MLWNSLSFLPTPPRPVSTPLVNIALTFHHLFVQRAPDTPARGPRRLPPPPGSRLPRITPRGQAAGSSLPCGPRQPCNPSLPAAVHSHPPPVPTSAANSRSSCAPKPPSHPSGPVSWGPGRGLCRCWEVDNSSSQPQASPSAQASTGSSTYPTSPLPSPKAAPCPPPGRR